MIHVHFTNTFLFVDGLVKDASHNRQFYEYIQYHVDSVSIHFIQSITQRLTLFQNELAELNIHLLITLQSIRIVVSIGLHNLCTMWDLKHMNYKFVQTLNQLMLVFHLL